MGTICEHGRQRSQCKECGGGSICEHGRRALLLQGVRWAGNLRARSSSASDARSARSSERIINQTITYGVACSSLTMTAFLSSSPFSLARHDRATSLS